MLAEHSSQFCVALASADLDLPREQPAHVPEDKEKSSPPGHFEQLVFATLLTSEAGQGVQEVWPVVMVTLLPKQAKQSKLLPNFPEGQAMHCVAPLTAYCEVASAVISPSSHKEQELSPALR